MSLRQMLTVYGGTVYRFLWRSPSSPGPRSRPFQFQFTGCLCRCSKLIRFSTAVTNRSVTIEDETSLTETEEAPTPKRKRGKPSKLDKEKLSIIDNRVSLKVPPKEKKFTPIEKTIVKYIDDHNEKQGLWNIVSKHDLKQMKVIPKTVYIIIKNEAKRFADAVKKENPDLNSPVLELHAGPGLLTEELVNSIGFQYVACMETYPESAESLKDRFNVSTIDLTLDSIPRYHHLDKLDGGERVQTLVLDKIKTAPESESVEKRQLHLVGALPHICSVNFLIRCFVSKKIFFEDDSPWSGVTMFVALGSTVHLVCTARPEDGFVPYRATTVLFNTLFKYKEIAVIPRKAFVPWESENTKETRKGSRKSKLVPKDFDNLRVYRIEVNEENVRKIGKENLFTFFYFVRQHMFARTNRVIPELEKWIPGCGIRLIKQGFNIFTQIGTLTPEEMLKLYMDFVSWPEFKNSSFLNAVEKYQTRIEVPEDDEEDLSSETTNKHFDEHSKSS